MMQCVRRPAAYDRADPCGWLQNLRLRCSSSIFRERTDCRVPAAHEIDADPGLKTMYWTATIAQIIMAQCDVHALLSSSMAGPSDALCL